MGLFYFVKLYNHQLAVTGYLCHMAALTNAPLSALVVTVNEMLLLCISSVCLMFQLVLVQLSDFSFTRTYNDSELMSELDSQMNDLYAMEVGQTDGAADIAVIAVSVAVTDMRIKRCKNLYVD